MGLAYMKQPCTCSGTRTGWSVKVGSSCVHACWQQDVNLCVPACALQAQLEIQLHQAQNQLSQLLHAGSVAHNQACSAHGRLRHSVKSLGKLYDLLKGVLEQWGTTNINKQVGYMPVTRRTECVHCILSCHEG